MSIPVIFYYIFWILIFIAVQLLITLSYDQKATMMIE